MESLRFLQLLLTFIYGTYIIIEVFPYLFTFKNASLLQAYHGTNELEKNIVLP